MEGPSPRKRGSVTVHFAGWSKAGSIPAQAGFRRGCLDGARLFEVHPRASGVQASSTVSVLESVGPSPRKRGSDALSVLIALYHGSIPAQAGFSLTDRSSRVAARVHPRASGVQHSARTQFTRARGPSPRKRGSDDREPMEPNTERSIPAQAGFSLPNVYILP